MKKLTRNQFAVYIAVATAKRPVRTGEVAQRAGIVWHSANVALKSLVLKGMVARDEVTKSYVPRQIEDLGSVVFLQTGAKATVEAAA